MIKPGCTYPFYFFQLSILVVMFFFIAGCKGSGLPGDDQMHNLDRQAIIFPDYRDITIPFNIAPLNFEVQEEGDSFILVLEDGQGSSLKLRDKNRQIRFPLKKWRGFLDENKGSSLTLHLYGKKDKEWVRYKAIGIRVAEEPIDPYLAYRLIPPGYETWSEMGLYQRDLTSFRERPIIENRHIEDNCVNCHAFSNGNSEHMLFHVRGSIGGTIIKRGDEIEKVDLKSDETLSAGVYPSWHPSGSYIAFSTNRIEQYFHAIPERSIEVLDRQSDLVLYDVKTKEIRHVPGTKGDRYMETYPNWSADGNFLYFSRTSADASSAFDSIRYDIYRIAFDPLKGTFGNIEAVLEVSGMNKSASFPRISPDGKYLLATIHDYGTFPIWHKEADLYLLNLENGQAVNPGKANSDDTDSYHSWAQNSRWIVFSSRRFDGRYTKLYLSYLDEAGEFQKAVLIPQRDPGFYKDFFFSYNKPELITGAVEISRREWIKIIRGK